MIVFNGVNFEFVDFELDKKLIQNSKFVILN